MNTLEIVAIVIVPLIAIFFVLKRRKKCASCSPKETLISEAKAPKPAKPQETKAADKPVVKAEPAAVNPQIPAAKIAAPPAKPQAKEATIAPAEYSIILPEDSILRRHHFTHLCSMIEALVPPRPTESVLCRHYDMMIVTKLAECLTDKNAAEQLVCDYEKLNA